MKRLMPWALGVLILIGGVVSLGAAAAQTGASRTIGSGEVLEEDVLFGGDAFENAGTIRGNLFLAAQNVLVAGTVEGNVFVAGQDVVIGGDVKGDVFVLSGKVTITGYVGGSVYAAAQTLTLQPAAEIGRSLTAAGYLISLYGIVGRDMEIPGAGTLIVKGLVAGDLTYSARTANIVSGTVKGELKSYPVATDAERRMAEASSRIAGTASYLFSTLVVWLLLTFVFREARTKGAAMLKGTPLRVFFLYGILGMGGSFLLGGVLLLTLFGTAFGFLTLLLAGAVTALSSHVFLVVLAGLLGERWPRLAMGNNILLTVLLALGFSTLRWVPVLGGVLLIAAAAGGFGLLLGGLVSGPESGEESSLIL